MRSLSVREKKSKKMSLGRKIREARIDVILSTT